MRPHIRGAIREYQTQLIQRVKDDIESLHEKFKVGICKLSKIKLLFSQTKLNNVPFYFKYVVLFALCLALFVS